MSEQDAGRRDLFERVGETLVAVRTGLGLDVEAAAERAGIDAERLAEAEAGEHAFSDGELRALADAYGVEVTAFFGGRVTPVSYLFGA